MVRSLTSSKRRLPFGRRDVDLVAFFLVEQRPANRRRGGDHALLDVGVFGHDQLVDDRLAVAVLEVDGRAEADLVVRDLVEVHQRDLADPLLQHADPRLDEPLPLLGGLVLGVLAQVAQLAGTLDFLRQLGLQLPVQRVDFVLELLEQPGFHVL